MKAELVVDAPIIGEKRIWVKKINKPYFDHPFHYHQLCELVWLEKSHGKLIVGDYVGNFSEGELIFKNAGLPHLWRCDPIFYQKKTSLCTKATTTYFPPTLIPDMTDEPDCLSQYKKFLLRAERGLRFYGKTRTQVIELIARMENSREFEQLSCFLQIINIITKTKEFKYLASVGYKMNPNAADIDRFNKVYQFLLKNFDREIMLEEVASICHMSPNSFCRFFKARTQKTFIRFLNELRIGHACKLLKEEQYPVQNICYECGYNTPVNFFRFFKLITGYTPQQYRKHMRNFEQA